MTRIDRPDSIRSLLSDLLTVFPDTDPKEMSYRAHMDRLAGEQEAGGLFLDPDGGFSEHSDPDTVSKGETLIDDAQIGRVFELRFGEVLTSTEIRVLRSVIAGYSIKEISTRDAVSHETRRNQLKTIMAKAGISRQVDLVAIMSTLLAVAVMDSGKEEIPPPARAFLDRFHGQGLRIYSPHLANGRRLLLLERGPVDGCPVLHMHSSFFPVLPIDDARLEEIGIRIVTPLRPGYFGLPVDWKMTANDRMAAFADDLATILRDFRLDNVPVYAHAHGATAAVALCARLGESVERLLVHAAFAGGPVHEKHQEAFMRAHKGLSCRMPKMLVRAYGLLGRTMVKPDNLNQMLFKLFNHSPADMRVLDNPDRRAWIQALFCGIGRYSGPGIVSDSQLHLWHWVETLEHLPIAKLLIYGSQERHSNFDQLSRHCAGTDAELRIVPDEGMLSMMFSCEDMLREAAGIGIEARTG